ncbi:hypothetical protein HUO13_30415 [Saccharopolyspora erythraea]|uniref:hypothetical protein n=1 Tax=Saccharopolyspora erythraea TaxID=1836 RepID=UPI001BA9408C|nr:hypothetical protein [Saccharopolyspora erythraea]QUH04517.1 hypothetical protein HUO13_30415 [Saccharopolyspora erythraea]
MTNPYGPPPGNQPYPPPGQPYPQPGQPAPQPGGYAPQSGPQPMPPAPQQGGYPQQPGMPPGQPMGQQPMGNPPMGPQMAPPPPGMGRVVLDSSYFVLAFILALFKPGITINGQPGPVATWGKTVIDLPPGQYQIQVHVNYLWKFGHAVAVVPVNAGQQVDVYYKAPAIAFGEGNIGPVPQEVPNLALTLVLAIGVPVLILLLGFLPLLMM